MEKKPNLFDEINGVLLDCEYKLWFTTCNQCVCRSGQQSCQDWRYNIIKITSIPEVRCVNILIPSKSRNKNPLAFAGIQMLRKLPCIKRKKVLLVQILYIVIDILL
ncbi:hypothetical protein AVEN_184171-1 [Araneus ventricosus]|uniref:Uncharacterized protein n=1 Tax=Araneus ventricosus TaxID=182803 RepID=A0A4Y2UQE1_ARAVE|nr:hypothetical protein AVEN_184171-1 [Araneus ventricosus]